MCKELDPAKFRADPTEFVDFMRYNIVKSMLAPGDSEKGFYELTKWKEAPDGLKWTAQPENTSVYQLRKVDAQTEASLPAYCCGYKQGVSETGEVGYAEKALKQSRSFMFTAQMNGCTFVVGDRHNDGAKLVAHLNLQRNAESMALEEMRDCAQGNFADRAQINARLEHPLYGSYGDKKLLEATTFGVLCDGEWRFYYQIASKVLPGSFGDPPAHYGLFRLV